MVPHVKFVTTKNVKLVQKMPQTVKNVLIQEKMMPQLVVAHLQHMPMPTKNVLVVHHNVLLVLVQKHVLHVPQIELMPQNVNVHLDIMK